MKKIISFAMCVVLALTFSLSAFAKFTCYGDVTCDKKVNSSDALCVLMASVGLQNLDSDGKRAADVDGNGKVNSTDALMILNFSIGKIKEFPVDSAQPDPDMGHQIFG